MRAINKLTAKQIEAFKEPGRYSDGGNLYLVITAAKTRQWIFGYRWQGKEKELGLGSAAEGRVSLKAAREAAQDARDAIAGGKDPQVLKDEKKPAIDKRRTWEQVVDEFLPAMENAWKNKKHAKQWGYSLKTLGAPLLPKLVNTIDVADVLFIVRPHWERAPETARRLRGRVETVLGYATRLKYRRGDPLALIVNVALDGTPFRR
jgi:hypothetical protein